MGDIAGVSFGGDPPFFERGLPTCAEGFCFIFVFKGDVEVEPVIAGVGEESALSLESVWVPGGGVGGVEAEVEEEVFEEGAEYFFLFEAKGCSRGLVDGLDEGLDTAAYAAELWVWVDAQWGEAEGGGFGECDGRVKGVWEVEVAVNVEDVEAGVGQGGEGVGWGCLGDEAFEQEGFTHS